MVVVGYSFGVITGFSAAVNLAQVEALVGIAPPLGKNDFGFMRQIEKPCCWLMGTDDFLYDDMKVQALKASSRVKGRFELLGQMDHFFRGNELSIAVKIEQFLQDFGVIR
jgi:alpha/beta superfamily hydrolase